MKVGVIARADLTGLGIQSRNWVRLLNPDKVIVINSSSFNGNEQHFEWYNKGNVYHIQGFIENGQIDQILEGLDVILTFEIPYNYDLIKIAKSRGVKTIIQNNWEFTDYLRNPDLPLPDLLVNHSYWHLDEQKLRWPNITEYCATPLFVKDYESIYLENLERKGKKRFLHIAGRKTYEDRNGTKDLIEAIKRIPDHYEFELVIKSQSTDVPYINDPRVTIDRDSPVDEKELYRGFDTVIMPRRYGGACLPMNEALASGLPVIMTDIDPNNKILPRDWLVQSKREGVFMARTVVDVYSVYPNKLAEKILDFVELKEDELTAYKERARGIAVAEYSSEAINKKWALLLEKLGL